MINLSARLPKFQSFICKKQLWNMTEIKLLLDAKEANRLGSLLSMNMKMFYIV